MGYHVLHDSEHEIAVLFDTASCVPFAEAWAGANAREEAESFLAFLLTRDPDGHKDEVRQPVPVFGRLIPPDATDPRCYTRAGLEQARDAWCEVCLDKTGRLNDYAWELLDWFDGPRHDPAPIPPKEMVA